MKKLFAVVVGFVASALGFIGSAVAAVPADVSTAIADMKTDALTVAAAFLVVTILIAAYMSMKKGAK